MVYLKIFLFFLIFTSIFTAPVKRPIEKRISPFDDLHYKSYLEEIVKELESDEKFAEAIKSAQSHNRTDHISESLTFVNYHIRNKLDEIKRREINRLNILEKELERRDLEARGVKVPPASLNFEKVIITDKDHIDHINPHSFENEDLKKLLKKTEEDLNLLDQKQEENYKEHEMKKEYLKKKKLESIKDPKEREELSKKFNESEKRHKSHEKVHHPGNQEQLKEVWEKEDHLDPNEFNPKAFFDIHDVNGDGNLDINELEALMQNELSKVYEANNTDDDMQERYHEMMRMRREMTKLIDINNDNLISKEEFLKYSSSSNFKDDSEWKTQEESDQKPYSDEEYKEFEDDYGSPEEDDDEFSDQDESLRHIPKDFIKSSNKVEDQNPASPPVAPPKV